MSVAGAATRAIVGMNNTFLEFHPIRVFLMHN